MIKIERVNESTEPTENEADQVSDVVAGPLDQIVMCACYGKLPGKKCFTETQYSIKKRRSGKESIPFLGLDAGEHKVMFHTDTKKSLCLVKVWISPFGWAWRIIKNLNT